MFKKSLIASGITIFFVTNASATIKLSNIGTDTSRNTSYISTPTNTSVSPKLPQILEPEYNDQISIERPDFIREGPTVQLAILLDTSSSMQGLIESTKRHIWRVVNEIQKANLDNEKVRIQVALYEYGKSSIPAHHGFIRQISPFTYYLEDVSDDLFSLSTNGGEEYAGEAISHATDELSWSNHPDDMKLMIIAGNEPFTQGRVPYEDAISRAREQGIILNTVFCNSAESHVYHDWKRGAKLGGGKSMVIDQNKSHRILSTPYDEELSTLSRDLDRTVIAIDKKGTERIHSKSSFYERIETESAELASSFAADLAINTVSNQQYNSWDATSVAVEDIDKAVSKLKESPEYKEKSRSDIKKILTEKVSLRKDVTEKIRTLRKKRDDYINIKSSELENDFGMILIESISEQMKSSGYTFN